MNILFGKPKSGKTSRIVKTVRKDIEARRQPLLLLPARYLKDSLTLRLAKEMGGFAGKTLFTFDEIVRAVVERSDFRKQGRIAVLSDFETFLLIRLIAQDISSEFKYFKNIHSYPGLIELLHGLIRELRAATLLHKEINPPEQENPAKWEDIRLLYAEYEKLLLSRNLFDEMLYIETAAKIVKEEGITDFDSLYIDGFYDFTAVQFLFIKALIDEFERANKPVTVALPDSEFPLIRDTFTLFHDSFHVETERLPDPENTFSLLAERILSFDNSRKPLELPSDRNVTLIDGFGKAREVELIALEIKRLAGTGNVEYNNIGVLVKNSGDYDHLIENCFRNFNIPFFNTKDKPLKSNPAVGYLLHLFRCAVKGIDSVDLISISNSGYTRSNVWRGLADSGSFLDEYFHGRRTEWENYIDGRIAFYRESAENLARKDLLDDELDIDTLERFRENYFSFLELLFRFDNNDRITFHDFNRWIADLIDASGMKKAVENQRSKNSSDYWIVSKDFTAFQKLKKILTGLRNAMKYMESDKIIFSDLFDLFSEIVSDTRYRYELFPEQCVKILTSYDLRETSFQTLFITGMNDGEFPGSLPVSILDQRERIKLNERARRILLPTEERRTGQERFDFYIAVSRPSDNLYLCRNSFDEKGEFHLPSLFINEIRRNISGRIISIPPVEGDEQFSLRLFDIVPSVEWIKIHDPAFFFATHYQMLSERFKNDPARRRELEKHLPGLANSLLMSSYMKKIDAEKAHSETGDIPPGARIQGILGGAEGFSDSIEEFKSHYPLSATLLENLGGCRYAFFLRYLIGVRKEDYPENKIKDVNKGLFLHDVMEKYLTATRLHEPGELPDSTELENAIGLAVDEFKRHRSHGLVFDFESEYYRTLLIHFCNAEKELRNEYTPEHFEFPLDKISLDLDGDKLVMKAQIDRIDKTAGGETYRIIDYKSGKVDQKAKDTKTIPLLGFQLYLYAAAFEAVFQGKDVIRELSYISMISPEKLTEGRVFPNDDETPFPEIWELKKREIKLLMSLLEKGNLSPYTLPCDFEDDIEIPGFYVSKKNNETPLESNDKCGHCDYVYICRRANKKQVQRQSNKD
ncbi:MAG: hypothetical protein A2Y33_04390 [Spirochaetes bacterium GWF1_51_8]|nr:MAG: hypothetical protein A2Y33_04390 [Spirochaetes bacterium GWF1_51_8]